MIYASSWFRMKICFGAVFLAPVWMDQTSGVLWEDLADMTWDLQVLSSRCLCWFWAWASATQWKRHPVHLQNKDSQQTWTQVIQPIQESRIEKFLRWILVAVFSEVILILDQKVGPKKVIIFTWDLVGRKDTARPEKNWPRKKDGHVLFFWPCFLNLPRMALDLSTMKSNDDFFLVYPTSDPFHTT